MSSTTLFLLATGLTYLAGALLFGPTLRRVAGRPAAGTARQPGPPPAGTDECQEAEEDRAHLADLHARLHTLSLGPTALDAAPDGAHRKVAERIAAAAARVSADPKHAPRRPGLLPQLLRAVNDDEASRHELSALIARDPALVASLLNLANSALHRRRPEPVESIGGAIALLGTTGIRSLLATAVMQPMFRRGEGRFPRFADVIWQHTLHAAVAAEAHAALVEQDDRFAAQLLGMLHGLGAIVVFRIALERYATVPGLEPHAGVIAEAIDVHGPTTAARVAESWDVSERLQQALLEQVPSGTESTSSPLGRSLAFGRLLGTLALLYNADEITRAQLHAALAAAGAPAAQVQRIWLRMTVTSPRF